MTIFSPGSTIGIIGGGQLGRMTALAAANLGYKTHIYCPEADCPAAEVAGNITVAAYDAEEALLAFAGAVDVVTFEFENIPHWAVQLLAEKTTVRPGWQLLHISQNRLREKNFFTGLGMKTAPYQAVSCRKSLQDAMSALGLPAILKTTEHGYDGKGQTMLRTPEDILKITDFPAENFYILEGFVHYSKEISVILARSASGEISCFSPTENRHINGILDTSAAPAEISDKLAKAAQNAASAIAEKLQLVGMLAIEFFVTGDDQLLVNEMAPRPHNSGHWTMDACYTSQFEQFVRAVCGLPFGSTREHSRAIMKNLIGDEVSNWPIYLSEANTKLHLYGKSAIRPGRKMGHATRLFPLSGK